MAGAPSPHGPLRVLLARQIGPGDMTWMLFPGEHSLTAGLGAASPGGHTRVQFVTPAGAAVAPGGAGTAMAGEAQPGGWSPFAYGFDGALAASAAGAWESGEATAPDALVLMGRCHEPLCAELASARAGLGPGRVFALVAYQTEPVLHQRNMAVVENITEICMGGTLATLPGGEPLFNEVWDYSWSNAKACTAELDARRVPLAMRPVRRVIPPGFLAEVPPPPARPPPAAAQPWDGQPGQGVQRLELALVAARYKLDAALNSTARKACARRVSDALQQQGAPQRIPAQRADGQPQQSGTAANFRLLATVWSLETLARAITGRRLFANIHKACGDRAMPLEAFRLSMLLSAGGLVISERSDLDDEAALSGCPGVAFVDTPEAMGALADCVARRVEPGDVLRAGARSREWFARERDPPDMFSEAVSSLERLAEERRRLAAAGAAAAHGGPEPAAVRSDAAAAAHIARLVAQRSAEERAATATAQGAFPGVHSTLAGSVGAAGAGSPNGDRSGGRGWTISSGNFFYDVCPEHFSSPQSGTRHR